MNPLLHTISIACILLPSIAHAQINRAKVLTKDFTTIQGDITSLNQDALVIINNQGISARINWDSAWGLSIMMPTNPKHLYKKITNQNALVFVDTIDGQRIFMTLLDSDNPDFILGSMGPTRLTISLEHIKTVWRIKQEENRNPLNQNPQPDTDQIKLTNGDTLTGFILNIGSTTTIETNTGIISVPLYQTQSIQLANPPTPRQFPGLYIHTDLGLTYHTNRFSLEPNTGKLTLTLVPGIIEYQPNSDPVLDNTLPNWPGLDLKLADIEIRHPNQWISDPLKNNTITYHPTGNRAWTPEPSTYNLTINTLDTGSIRFHAPTQLITQIDPHATRLRCDYTPAHLPWTNHTASIQAIDANNQHSIIWTQQLTGQSGTTKIDTPIPAGTIKLAFIIDPGINGPIQDAGHFDMIRILVKDEP